MNVAVTPAFFIVDLYIIVKKAVPYTCNVYRTIFFVNYVVYFCAVYITVVSWVSAHGRLNITRDFGQTGRLLGI
jgi:hypothetical protein